MRINGTDLLTNHTRKSVAVPDSPSSAVDPSGGPLKASPACGRFRFPLNFSEGRYGKASNSGADTASTELQAVLRRLSDISGASALADRLESCSAGGRCRLLTCSKCTAAAGHWLEENAETFVERTFDEVAVVDLELPDSQPLEQFNGPASYRLWKRFANTAFQATGITNAIGMLSLTVREHADGTMPTLVVPTVRCVTSLAEAREANKAEVGKPTIHTYFPNASMIMRKARVTAVEPAALSIGFQRSVKRSVYAPQTIGADGDIGRKQQIHSEPLRAGQRALIAVAQAEAGLKAPLVLVGTKIVKTPEGRWVLKAR